MTDFFPQGFWPTVATIGMVVFFVCGVDLLLGSRLVSYLGRFVNKKYQVDQAVVHMLQELKKVSDREYDMERALLHGKARFLMGGVLLFGAALILFNVLPRIK